MRARIKQDSNYSDAWLVYTKVWWFPVWIHRKSFVGDDAHEQAFWCAKRYLNPKVTEVTK